MNNDKKKDAPLAPEASQIIKIPKKNNSTKKTSSQSNGRGRTRNWTFIVYPDSAPENWRDVIDEEHIQWVESPLHDKDVNADNTPKKPHWHILLIYESVKDYTQVVELTQKCNATVPQKCNGTKGLVRYMAHIDNPEKYQYSKADIKAHGGVDVAELLKPTSSDRYILIREMSNWIKDNDVSEYEDIWFYAMENRFDDWFPLLCDNSSYAIGCLLKSRRHRCRTQDGRPFNPVTGEIQEDK